MIFLVNRKILIISRNDRSRRHVPRTIEITVIAVYFYSHIIAFVGSAWPYYYYYKLFKKSIWLFFFHALKVYKIVNDNHKTKTFPTPKQIRGDSQWRLLRRRWPTIVSNVDLAYLSELKFGRVSSDERGERGQQEHDDGQQDEFGLVQKHSALAIVLDLVESGHSVGDVMAPVAGLHRGHSQRFAIRY